MKYIHALSATIVIISAFFYSTEYLIDKDILAFSKETKNAIALAPTCSIIGSDYVCSNSAGNIYTAPPGMTSYLWTITGNGTIQGSTTSQSVSVTAGNYLFDYIVYLTITDGTGSSSCSKQSYIYLNTPPADIAVSQDTVCFGVTINLSIPSASSSTVSWSGEGITNPNGTHASGRNSTSAFPTSTGTHIYSVSVVSDYGCRNTDTVTVYVKGLFPFYADSDGDGYGAGGVVNLCTNNASSPPSGYSIQNGDCNDADPAIKPGAVEICDNKDNDCDGLTDEGDASFSWIAGPWSSCSVICGTGNQSRSVTCKNQIGQTVADCNCIQSEKPAISQSCFGSTPQSTWYQDSDNDTYGNPAIVQLSCNQPLGFVSNNEDCNDSDNTVHPGAAELCDNKDNDCDGSTDEGPCTTYSWTSGQWSTCSVTCGGGTQSRTVSCIDGFGNIVAGSLCDPNTQPSSSQSCNTNPCPTYSWSTSPWGPCSVTCGGGTQSRTVNCIDENGNIVAGSLCDPNTQPSSSQSCNTNPCPTYSWSTSPWGPCSVTCGGGTQSRTVNCIDENGNIVAGSLCDPNTQPSSSQSCNTNPCPTYSWSASPWGPCSVTCGGGTQSRTVNCIDENGNIVAGSLCDPNTQPASSQNCTGTQGAQSFYLDSDSDGYGNPNLSILACTAPTGYVSNNLDCNDANAGINPGASDANCNGIDEDCDGIADDNYIAATCTACSGGVVVSTVTNVGITGLNTLNISSTSVKLSWDLNPLFESYDLDYRFSGGWISVNNIIGNMITLSNLTTNKLYEWRIRGKCAGGNLGKYTNSTFNTFAPCALAPTGLSATNITGNSATLNWNVVQGAISYTVQYLNSFTNTWAALTSVNTNTYNWTGLSTRRVYSWRVSANCTANSSPFASSQFRTKNSLVELENRSVDITATVFPNPVKEKLNIVLSDGSLPEGITLFDAQGKMMLKYSKNITVVDMKPFGSGIYILQIKSGKKIENIKIVKE